MKLTTVQIDQSGVHRVFSELNLHGHDSELLHQNYHGYDIRCHPDKALLSIKTSAQKNRYWPVHVEWGGLKCWYVFVRLLNNQIDEILMVHSKEVLQMVQANRTDYQQRGLTLKAPTWGYTRQGARLMKEDPVSIRDRARRTWEKFLEEIWSPMKIKGQRCRIKGTSPYFLRKYGTSNPIIIIEGTDREVFGQGWLRMDGNVLCLLFGLRTGEERQGLPTCNVYHGRIEGPGFVELVWADELEDLEEKR